jgi:DNA-binding transcriptional MerR regulator/effector-binding domain-containing protein
MFRIGEFSIIAQVSGRLLRYYDEIGLLIPEHTDPQSGYRYYNANQLPRLNKILAAKELGFSLEQIARLLEQNISVSEIRGMLTLRKAEIERSVQTQAERLRQVESRLEQIETHGLIHEPDVVLKAVSAQYFLFLREVFLELNAVRRLIEMMNVVVPTAIPASNLGHIAIVVHSPAYDPDAFDFEVGYLLTKRLKGSVRLSDDHLLTVRELPAIEKAATLAHVGLTSDIHRTYGLLAQWLERNGWQISGAGRQIMMQLPSRNLENNAVIELQMPVCKLEHP